MNSTITVGGNRWERKKEETKKKIIGIALELFRKQGFESTTMEQIAIVADVAKGTLYNYFPGKETILSEYMQRTVRGYEPELRLILEGQPDTRSRLNVLLQKISEWNARNEDIVRMHVSCRMQNFLKPQTDPTQWSSFEFVLARVIRLGQESGEIKQELSAEALARYFKAMYSVIFMGWLIEPDQFPLQQNINETVDLFLNGAGKEQKRDD